MNKVRCFINAGFSLSLLKTSPHYKGGSPDWLPPNKMGQADMRLNYNLSAGVKIPVCKRLGCIIMLQYEDSFHPISIETSAYPIFTKTQFLSLHIGLCL